MASKASIGGHPIHPMLVPFPLALWITSFVTDVVYYFERNASLLLISKFMIAAGCLGAVAAAIPGIIDWLALKQPEVNRISNWHARLNIIALIIFAISLYLRLRTAAGLVSHRIIIAFLLSFVGVILIVISGWLGGEMAYKYGVGVAPRRDTPAEESAKVRSP